MNFLEHPSFSKEIKAIQKKQRGTDSGLASLKLLLTKQFDPQSPLEVIGPSKINRVFESSTWEIWKVKMAIPSSGLRPSQWPRVWLVVGGDTVAFLAIAQHSENYNDNDFERTAKDRATDIF